MSRKTYLQCVNSVLRLLRQSQVSTYSASAYSTMIADFVNDSINHVESMHDWSALLKETSLSLTSGDALYSLQNWQDNGRIERVRNVTSDYKGEIRPISAIGWACLNHDVSNAQPSKYRLREPDSSGDPQLEFYPTPDKAYSVTVYGYVGQGNLNMDSTLVLVPSLPVIRRAYAEAVRERGEDGGSGVLELEQRAHDALQDAIDLDRLSQDSGVMDVVHLEPGRIV